MSLADCLSIEERAFKLRKVLSQLESCGDGAVFRAQVLEALRLLAGDILDQLEAYDVDAPTGCRLVC